MSRDNTTNSTNSTTDIPINNTTNSTTDIDSSINDNTTNSTTDIDSSINDNTTNNKLINIPNNKLINIPINNTTDIPINNTTDIPINNTTNDYLLLPKEILMYILEFVDLHTYCNIIPCCKWIYSELVSRNFIDKYTVADVYRNGNTISVRTTVGDKLHELYRSYRNNKLTYNGFYQYGFRDGIFTVYNNGRVESTRTYRGGNLINSTTEQYRAYYYKNIKHEYMRLDSGIEQELYYRNNMLHGLLVYRQNGSEIFRANITNNIVRGIVEYNGKLIDTSKISDTVYYIGTCIKFISTNNGLYCRISGSRCVVGFHKDGKKYGTWYTIFPDKILLRYYNDGAVIQATAIDIQNIPDRYVPKYIEEYSKELVERYISLGTIKERIEIYKKYRYEIKYMYSGRQLVTFVCPDTKHEISTCRGVITSEYQYINRGSGWIPIYFWRRNSCDTRVIIYVYEQNKYAKCIYDNDEPVCREIYHYDYIVESIDYITGKTETFINGFTPSQYMLYKDKYIKN